MSCISATVSRIGGISATVSLVCEIDKKKYLLVKPEEVQWIDINTSIDYNVISNLNWVLH